MINDHLHIRCTFCGKHEIFAKFYGDCLQTLHGFGHVEHFFSKHFKCNPAVVDPLQTELGDESGFEILSDNQMNGREE